MIVDPKTPYMPLTIPEELVKRVVGLMQVSALPGFSSVASHMQFQGLLAIGGLKGLISIQFAILVAVHIRICMSERDRAYY